MRPLTDVPPMLDLVVRNAVLPDGRDGMTIGCDNGRIVALSRQATRDARRAIDARGCLAAPPFADAHFHMDSTLTYGRPRVNRSGTLLEGIELWGELKPSLSHDEIRARALELCRWAVARGTLAIRSHVDVCDPSLRAVKALLEVRGLVKGEIDLQLVAFPQDGFLRSPVGETGLTAALDLAVDVVGGIPHFERTMADGAASVERLCRIAADRGLLVDMHCDETDDPLSRNVEVLAREAIRHGLQGRVVGSHLTAMHSMDNYYVSKLIPLMHEAAMTAVANPLINITLQGRHDSYPKRRGMTRVKELLAAGVNVACGHDCVMDPWYPLGSHDMLDVAHMGLHVGRMTGSGTSARSSRAALMGSRSPAASTTGARDAAMRPVMSGAPTAKAAGSKATVHPPSPSAIAASATASGATRPVSPASLRCRSAASRRLAYFGFGRVDSARARASSSSVQATLMPNPHTAETRTPNRPLARVSATTPPSEWPSATTRSAGGTAGATAAARRPKEYDTSASEPPCPGRSGATHRPGHRSFRRSSNPRHTSPVAPSPCSSNNTGPPSPPCWTRNRSLIGRRGGPRHGPPHPPTLGRP